MTKHEVLEIVRNHVDEDTLEEIANELPNPEEEYEARCESIDAARFEDAAHGFDFDEERGITYDPNTGMSVYDLDPGIEYNDAGEPKGYM